MCPLTVTSWWEHRRSLCSSLPVEPPTGARSQPHHRGRARGENGPPAYREWVQGGEEEVLFPLSWSLVSSASPHHLSESFSCFTEPSPLLSDQLILNCSKDNQFYPSYSHWSEHCLLSLSCSSLTWGCSVRGGWKAWCRLLWNRYDTLEQVYCSVF